MKQSERHHAILNVLSADGQARVEDLCEALGASPATVRRDLDVLATQGLINRVHGGARAVSVAYDLPLRYKDLQHIEAKQAIAIAASELVDRGSVIGLSGGTTTTRLAAALAVRPDIMDASANHNLTVVTNAVNIAAELATRPQVKLVVTGGVLHTRSYELVGRFAEDLIAGVSLSLAFIGANSLDVQTGASTHDEREAVINGLMARRAKRAVLLVDSSKLGRWSFAHMGGSETFHTVITDAGADPQLLSELRDAGYEMIVAPVSPG